MSNDQPGQKETCALHAASMYLPPCMSDSDPARPAAQMLQMVTVWAQCGGKYGGNRCMSKPDGSARCADAAWGWVRCPAASACKRLNYGFWQCIPA